MSGENVFLWSLKIINKIYILYMTGMNIGSLDVFLKSYIANCFVKDSKKSSTRIHT